MPASEPVNGTRGYVEAILPVYIYAVPRLDLKFPTPSECEILSEGLKDPSARQRQFGTESGFPDRTGSRLLCTYFIQFSPVLTYYH
jgi:hypothetical protein